MKKMHILVTGANGQLGRSLAERSDGLAAEWTFATRQDLDLNDEKSVRQYFAAHQFTHCVHTAAYTQVDKAEEEQDIAYRVNAEMPGLISALCAEQGASIIHFSTDYVYHSEGSTPLTETDTVAPRSVYGKSKLEGESNVLTQNDHALIIRTSWVFSEYGHNFVKTIYRLLSAGRALKVVDDQYGCPTYAGDLADAVIEILRSGRLGQEQSISGIYHYSNAGATTWYLFARAIAEVAGLDADITPVSTAEYGAAAPRPPYSVLNSDLIRKVFGVRVPHWKPALERVIDRLREAS